MALPRLPRALSPLAAALARPGCGRALHRAAPASAPAAPGEKEAFVLSPLPPPLLGFDCWFFFFSSLGPVSGQSAEETEGTLVINCFPRVIF